MIKSCAGIINKRESGAKFDVAGRVCKNFGRSLLDLVSKYTCCQKRQTAFS